MEIEVIYHSLANENLSETDIYNLVKKAQENNKLQDITGCLLYHNKEFIQALEGEEKNINALLEKIKNDTRHTQMHIIYKGECTKRSYSRWNMAYDALTSNDLIRLESVIDLQGFSALHSIKDSPSRVKKMLSYLSKEMNND